LYLQSRIKEELNVVLLVPVPPLIHAIVSVICKENLKSLIYKSKRYFGRLMLIQKS